MINQKHRFPEFLRGRCEEGAYRRWLYRKAMAHARRDRARGYDGVSVSAYKAAIHEAVERSQGIDAYTGEQLEWQLLSRWNNEESKAGRTKYKQSFGDLPTVDHAGEGGGGMQFKICAWRTNDAKNDLSYVEFVRLCRAVVEYDRQRNADLQDSREARG